jgi:ribosomal protein S18 acetylase RimI-like enzyme
VVEVHRIEVARIEVPSDERTRPPGSMIRVDPATPADFGRIAELTAGVYRDEGLAPEEYLSELADVAGRADRAQLLVARDGGAVVGSVALVVEGDFGEITASEDEASFRMLVVDPAVRGRGVGELLVTTCLTRARAAGKRRVVLSTDPKMVAAHRIYERLGFTRLPERDWSPLPGVQLMAYALDL